MLHAKEMLAENDAKNAALLAVKDAHIAALQREAKEILAVKDAYAHIVALQTQLSGILKTENKVYMSYM